MLDVFLMILYARANQTVYSMALSHFTWRAFVRSSKLFGRWRQTFLTLCGPVTLLFVLASWAWLLSLAAALIIHPNLGTAIISTHGTTPTDFLSALYVGGSSLSFIGATDFFPQTPGFRFFFLLTSLSGVTLASLVVTYLMELYNDLKQRNVLGLMVELLSSQTGDAAEVVARLGPRGEFQAGYQNLMEWSADTARVRESHHFYPILFYFRFREPYFSVSRTALVSLDTVSLIRSALDDEDYGWLKQSAAVDDLWRGTMVELRTLVKNFVPDVETESAPDEAMRRRWERRYAAAVERLRGAGIKTATSGAEQYISLRTQWDTYITSLAPTFAYGLDEIDTALAKLE
jgi:hypothetical protein